MDVKAMIGQVDAEIAALEERLRRLRDARETIASLGGPVTPGGYHQFQTNGDSSRPRRQKRTQPNEVPARKRSGKSFLAAVVDKKTPVRDQILTVLKSEGKPMTSAEIISKMNGARKQTVWAALSDMHKKGVLNKDDKDCYSLVA